MKPIERRLAAIEDQAQSASTEFDGLSAEELGALIAKRLTEWYHKGITLEQIGETLIGLGNHETAKTIAEQFIWDPEAETVRRVPKHARRSPEVA